jgi:hypothetical protein
MSGFAPAENELLVWLVRTAGALEPGPAEQPRTTAGRRRATGVPAGPLMLTDLTPDRET